MIDISESIPTPPEPEEIMDGTRLSSAFEGKLFTLSKWLAREVNEDWIFKDLVCKGEVIFLYGPPKSGKTFITIDLMLSAVIGSSWCNDRFTAPKPRRVIYCAGEGHRGLGKRISAAIECRDISPEQISDRLRIVPLVPQLYGNGVMDLGAITSDNVRYFINEVKATGFNPDMVVIDTYNRATLGAEENSNSNASIIMRALQSIQQELDCAVLVVHHAGKDGKFRGASAVIGSADLVLQVERSEYKNRITCEHAKEIPVFPSVGFDLLPYGESAIVTWSGDGELGDQPKSAKFRALDYLQKEALRESGTAYRIRDIAAMIGLEPNYLTRFINDLFESEAISRRIENPDKKHSNAHNPHVYYCTNEQASIVDR